MARDYKPRSGNGRSPGSPGPKRTERAGKSKAKPPTPPWVWVAAGFTLGIGVAAGVHVYLQAPVSSGRTIAAAGGATDGMSTAHREKTRFEFYSLLPEMEVVVPESEVAGRTAVKADKRTREAPARYILQAGAFRSLADADRLRASLALTGLEATIQTVSVDGNETWHRVRLGPYSDVESLNSTRTRLRRASINAMVLKIKT